MKKLFLLLLITLLAFTNINAETFNPPVEVGDEYTFRLTEVQNCATIAINSEDNEKIYHDESHLITDIDIENKQIEYDSTFSGSYDRGSDPVFQTKALTTNYWHINFVGLFILDSYEGRVQYYPVAIRNYIEPDFENITSQITEWVLDPEYYFYAGDYILPKADSITFMGEDSLEDGIEKLDSTTREWSIIVDLSTYKNYEVYEVGREFKYSKEGVLEYHNVHLKMRQ